MKEKILIGSIIAVSLLTLVSFSNVVGYNTVKTSQEELIYSEYSFDECKDYLFETIVEISENPEIKDIIKSNYKPQRTMLPFRRNNVDLKVEHLELLYEMGLKIMDRLGEDKVEELMENIEMPDYADDLDAIVMGNDELRERICTLNEMNAVSGDLEWEFTIICGIIDIMCLPWLIIMSIFWFPQIVLIFIIIFSYENWKDSPGLVQLFQFFIDISNMILYLGYLLLLPYAVLIFILVDIFNC